MRDSSRGRCERELEVEKKGEDVMVQVVKFCCQLPCGAGGAADFALPLARDLPFVGFFAGTILAPL